MVIEFLGKYEAQSNPGTRFGETFLRSDILTETSKMSWGQPSKAYGNEVIRDVEQCVQKLRGGVQGDDPVPSGKLRYFSEDRGKTAWVGSGETREGILNSLI